MNVVLAAALVSPTLILCGLVWALLRWFHRSAHHWAKVWALPEKVEALTASVDHHTEQIATFGQLVQTLPGVAQEPPRGERRAQR